jgi:hypothetical protein
MEHLGGASSLPFSRMLPPSFGANNPESRLIRYDPRKVFAFDAPGSAPPIEPDGACIGNHNDSFVCEAVT